MYHITASSLWLDKKDWPAALAALKRIPVRASGAIPRGWAGEYLMNTIMCAAPTDDLYEVLQHTGIEPATYGGDPARTMLDRCRAHGIQYISADTEYQPSQMDLEAMLIALAPFVNDGAGGYVDVTDAADCRRVRYAFAAGRLHLLDEHHVEYDDAGMLLAAVGS